MTLRLGALLAALMTLLACAVSLGGRLFWLFAIFLALILFFALLSALPAACTLHVSQALSADKTIRETGVELRVTCRFMGLFPISPIVLFTQIDGVNDVSFLDARAMREARLKLPIPARHVGRESAGVLKCVVSDAFGLFSFRRNPDVPCAQLTVLPRPFEVEALRFLNEDDGKAMQNRTTEDLTSPDSVRAYRTGDPLKKVHWKLSFRKHSLIVRSFETPAPPDTLVLLDCTAPRVGDDLFQGERMIRDALCETALSASLMQMKAQCPVRLPFYGGRVDEFQSDHTGTLANLQEMLAGQTFSGGEEFSRVLQLELRRMRRTGATVIVTSRLNAQIVESVTRIRRMGPSVRFYLVTFTPDAQEDLPYIARLQQYMVEVCYVTPAQ